MSKKIIIIGNTCSGKTTLGQVLSSQMEFPHFDLDEFHWLPNWIERPDEDMIADLRKEVLPHEKWIITGNYTSVVKDVIWPDADTIVWLNYPLRVVLYRFFKRTYRRIVHKEKCCNGNQETFGAVFLNHDGLFYWAVGTHYPKIRKFNKWKNEIFKDKHWIELTNPKQAQSLLPQLLDSVH